MHIVIIGNGIAGVTAARIIRENKPNVSISLYTNEKYVYYPRPRLYELLSEEVNPVDIFAFSPEWYQNRDLRIHLNTEVLGIEISSKALLLEDHSRVYYDRLLLANGSHPFIPPIKGVEKKGVFTLRSIDDSMAIKKYVSTKRNVVIIGGGLLGLELAVAICKLSHQVKVVERFPRLLPRQLDHDGAEILKELLERYGIEFILGVNILEILGEKEVSGIVLDNGRILSCTLILVSAGIKPNVVLARTAGINVNKGVLVDKYMQTSVSDVYAAGDVTEFEGRIYGIIPAAIDQGKIAAMTMLGDNQYVYKGTTPSNMLKIVDIELMSIGITNLEEVKYEELKKMNKKQGIYKKLVFHQGKIIGAIILGDKKAIGYIKRFINQKVELSKYKELLLEDNFDYSRIIT
jgi:nitrite reductase (NADH) large subunit